jgi:hypothetical protein
MKQKFITRKQLKDEQKKIKKSYRWWTEIELTCSICKRIFIVNTTQPNIYTKEVKDKTICLLCKSKKEKIINRTKKEEQND